MLMLSYAALIAIMSFPVAKRKKHLVEYSGVGIVD